MVCHTYKLLWVSVSIFFFKSINPLKGILFNILYRKLYKNLLISQKVSELFSKIFRINATIKSKESTGCGFESHHQLRIPPSAMFSYSLHKIISYFFYQKLYQKSTYFRKSLRNRQLAGLNLRISYFSLYFIPKIWQSTFFSNIIIKSTSSYEYFEP